MFRSFEELQTLLDEEDVRQAQELLDHVAWVVLESQQFDHDVEPSVYGPFGSAAEGFAAAAALEASHRSAAMHAHVVAEYGSFVYRIVPLWGQL
jgi:hypothetical protein